MREVRWRGFRNWRIKEIGRRWDRDQTGDQRGGRFERGQRLGRREVYGIEERSGIRGRER